jgi:transcriptional regulator with XRE-family HTH domain
MLPDDLGDRIRRLRRQQNVTLAELSERSGVPLSTLSKIENAHVKKTSADNLFKIARGLGVFFERLVEHRPATVVTTGRRVITRRESAEKYCTEIYDYFAHSADLLKKRMVPLRMRVKTRDVPELHDWSHHDGEEWIFVVKGVIDLHTEHYAPVRLKESDSAYFDSAMRHCFVNTGKGEAIILSVCLVTTPLDFAERGARFVEADEARLQDGDPAPA